MMNSQKQINLAQNLMSQLLWHGIYQSGMGGEEIQPMRERAGVCACETRVRVRLRIIGSRVWARVWARVRVRVKVQ